MVLERERVDLAGLCRAAAEAFQPRAADKRQALKLEIDSSAGVVVGDSRRLRESIDHVLRNAVAYTPEGGHIILSASGDAETVNVTVADDGPGIPPEDRQDVFNRFHRAVGSQRGEAALGLGLPLTRQFIEAHGGRVELDSEVGEGTAVRLLIPRAPQ